MSNVFTGFEFRHSVKENLVIINKTFNNSFGISIVDCKNGIFQQNTLEINAKYGFHLFSANESNFENNFVTKSQRGYALFFSNLNEFTYNSALLNEDRFFLESESNNNKFINNSVINNLMHGFTINWGNNNIFQKNNPSSNGKRVSVRMVRLEVEAVNTY